MTQNTVAASILFALLAMGLSCETARGHEPGSPARSARWDISLDVPTWPGLRDLQPAGAGSFDPVGIGLGGSFHWPVTRLAASELLLGFDGSIAVTGSSIRGDFETLQARQLYIGTSAKWLPGDRHNVSLDAGIGFHMVDMAQVDIQWYGTYEFEHWSSARPGGYIGGTWDIGASRSDHNSGLFVAFKIHFADFGRVYDEEFSPSWNVLGADAGTLDGPLYVLRIGYSVR